MTINSTPRLPARANGVVSASVLHDSAMAADAWASALAMLGVAAGMAAARRAELAGRIVDTAAAEHLLPALAAMLID